MSERTLFYPQNLVGQGTGQVQSLLSYVEHLALAHSMKPRALVETLFRRFPVDGVDANEMTEIVLRGKVNSGLPAAVRFQEALEEATGCSLAGATVGKYSAVFASTNLTRHKEIVCCPACVREGDALPYMPLLWDFQCVTACPRHKVKLVAIPACGAPLSERLKPHQRPTLSGICTHCGSIGYKCAHLEVEEASAESVWVAAQVEQLLAAGDAPGITQETLLKGLRTLVNESFGGSVVRAAVESGMSRGLVCTWLKGAKPGLPWVVQLCFHAGVSIAALARGEVRRACSSGGAGTATHKAVPRTYQRASQSRAEMRSLLRSAASAPDTPSLERFAADNGLHPRALREWFPEEVRALTSLTLTRRQKDSEERYSAALRAYGAAAEELRSKGDAVHARTVQQASGMVAFSRNRPRARALEVVLAKHSTSGGGRACATQAM